MKRGVSRSKLVGLLRFRPCDQVSSRRQHFLLISLPVLSNQFCLSREPVLIFPQYIGGRLGIANMFGRFKRRLHALVTPGKPTVRKFPQACERGFLVSQNLMPIGAKAFKAAVGCKMFGTKVTLSVIALVRLS
jgi:hypothetical protein